MIKENPDAIVQFNVTFLLCLNYKCVFFDDQDAKYLNLKKMGQPFNLNACVVKKLRKLIKLSTFPLMD